MSDSGGPCREGGRALGESGARRAGRDAAALVHFHVGVGVLEGRPVGALHVTAPGGSWSPGSSCSCTAWPVSPAIPVQAHGPQDLPSRPHRPAPGLRGPETVAGSLSCQGCPALARTAPGSLRTPARPRPFPKPAPQTCHPWQTLLWEPALGRPPNSRPFLLPVLPGLTVGRGLASGDWTLPTALP